MAFSNRTTVEVSAVFIGTDGSLGYKKYEIYFLNLTIHDKRGAVKIEDTYNKLSKPCVYTNIIAFLENWYDVKIIK